MSRLRYSAPAKFWHEALPIGNGRIAVMVYGGKNKERLAFNDATLWSGYPKNHDRKESYDNLSRARELVFNGKYPEATEFVQNNLYGNYSEAYMPLGELTISVSGNTSGEYYRELSLDDALMTVCSGSIRRSSFVSYPDNVAVSRIESDSPFSIKIKARTRLKGTSYTDKGMLILSGNAPDYAAPNYLIGELFPIRYNEGKAMAFCLITKVVSDGEVIFTGKSIKVRNATYVNIYSRTGTGFKGYDKMPQTDRNTVVEECMAGFSETCEYQELLRRHKEDYKRLYEKHSLRLSDGNSDVKAMLDDADKGNVSADLINLFYNYGKYMTIAGSRDSQPLNLQGQWNNSKRPPWSSNLTTNINFEMNYWATSEVNLKECLYPFYNSVKEIVARGKKTAKVNYNADGFACNHNVDIWRNTSPVKGNPAYMYAPLCGIWIANEMMKHKLNTIRRFDSDAEDILREAALFCLDYLTEKDGYLVTCPSASPELDFYCDGKRCALGYASAFEMAIIRECFMNVMRSNLESSLKERVEEAEKRLLPYKKAEDGRLYEWNEDFTIKDKGHRHFSPLYGVYPGTTVGYYSDKDLCDAAYKLFRSRVDNSSSSIGWSAAWGICLAGRFHDKNTADKIIRNMMKKSVLPNLFDYHPPTYFQIDGNLGFIAGINNLLVYEERGIIEMLPACPEFMSSGAVKGHIVNGIELEYEWKDGEIVSLKASENVKVRKAHIASDAELKNVELI